MSNRIRILYIAYYFPPLGGVASLRSLKMVKYLYRLGIDCSVLCLNPKGMNYPKDHSLLLQIPESCRIYRFSCLDFSWFFKVLYGLKLHSLVKYISQNLLIPDLQVVCKKAAGIALDRLMYKESKVCERAENSPKLALISSGPPSSLFLGLRLKQKHKLDFLCDFRDEWTNNPERLNIDYPHRSQSRELLWEARILAACSGICYLTGIMQKNYEERYVFLKDKPSRLIQNGYDEEDFQALKPTKRSFQGLSIVYTGSFYDRRQPDSLWQAITELEQEGKLDESQIRIEVVGKNNQSFVLGHFAESSLINRIVCLEPFASHTKSLQMMNRSDALLLYIPSGKNTESVLTGKIFDYIRSGKPILALVPPQGLAARIVQESGLGLIADYHDIAGIKRCLTELLAMHQEKHCDSIVPNWEYISQYSRENQAAKLASLIGECIPSANYKPQSICRDEQ